MGAIAKCFRIRGIDEDSNWDQKERCPVARAVVHFRTMEMEFRNVLFCQG